jgi:predicted DNA-binding ribbon-helix-helix protein
MKSPIIKRSIDLGGHKTSVSLENAFWDGLREIADSEETTIVAVIQKIDNERQQANLSSAIRLFVLNHFRSLTAEKRRAAGDSPPQVPLPLEASAAT